jgi:hypothetical protein
MAFNPEGQLAAVQDLDLQGLLVSTKTVASVSEAKRNSGPRTRSVTDR